MSNPNTIVVSPIGDIPLWICEIVVKKVEKFFGFKSVIISVLNDISFAYNPERNQYHSTQILKELEQQAPEGTVKILGITKEDLFIPILTHVYGEAQLDGKACIISISRLVKGMGVDIIDKGSARIVKEAVHELGHCFNLRHCQDSMCLMHYCRKIDDVDKKISQFCRYCDILLTDNIKLSDE
ncbi:MAG: hypothetical protein ABIJ59_15875 [Pseudomonadota bacterium]